MKITKLEEQGIRLALCLAREQRQLTLPELAQRENLSEALVAKVMSKLRRGGVVKAARGRVGGYELTSAPDSLTLASVMRALGRPLLEGCFNSGYDSSDEICPHVSDCGLRPIWEFMSNEVTRVMERITLSELIKKERFVREQMSGLSFSASPKKSRKRGKKK